MKGPNKKPLTASIPYQVLQRLSERYKNDKHQRVSSGLGKRDTIAVFFENDPSLKEICQKIINGEASGIRFYFGAYDDHQVDEGGTGVILPHDPRYIKQMTLAFVTTRRVGNSDVDDTTDEKAVFFLRSGNNGKLCPPDTGCE